MDVMITLGPASWHPDVLGELLRLKVRLVRFPFAKETPDIHATHHAEVRAAARTIGANVETLADLPGGKPRLDNELPISVSAGESYSLAVEDPGDGRTQTHLALDPPMPDVQLRPGARAAIGDGENTFLVEQSTQGVITGHFERDGILERRRAFVPLDEDVPLPTLTDADRVFARAAQVAGFDWLALSFVKDAESVRSARVWLDDSLQWRPQLMAKIETSAGVRRADEIAAEADAVLIGRGDLVLHVGLDGLWDAQASTLAACRRAGRYAVVGTGFLESTASTGSMPTRAEAIDVMAARAMGADALMLSAETTIGADPVGAVLALQQLAAGPLPPSNALS
jgi:pyruvate kinase